jgi:hypothetical protein
MGDANSNIGDLGAAIRELEDSLQHAAAAAARIKDALPRLERMSAAFEELESIIEAGRRAAAAPAPTSAPATIEPPAPLMADASQPIPIEASAAAARTPRPTKPKLVGPRETDDNATPNILRDTPAVVPDIETIAAIGTNGDKLISFRLEFESNPGPLDLRAVDDAVSEHPAVRDVALLDYDGRRATLKVWITATASAAEVQKALTERASKIVSDGSQVSIIALEDVA